MSVLCMCFSVVLVFMMLRLVGWPPCLTCTDHLAPTLFNHKVITPDIGSSITFITYQKNILSYVCALLAMPNQIVDPFSLFPSFKFSIRYMF